MNYVVKTDMRRVPNMMIISSIFKKYKNILIGIFAKKVNQMRGWHFEILFVQISKSKKNVMNCKFSKLTMFGKLVLFTQSAHVDMLH